MDNLQCPSAKPSSPNQYDANYVPPGARHTVSKRPKYSIDTL